MTYRVHLEEQTLRQKRLPIENPILPTRDLPISHPMHRRLGRRMPQRIDPPNIKVVVVGARDGAVEQVLDDILDGDGDVDHEGVGEVFVGVEVPDRG